MFIDEARIFIRSGKGGDGHSSFRKEKFVPKGGPDGGNGGKGGDVIFLADPNLHTLLDFNYKKKYAAEDGENGGKSLKDGKSGNDIIIKVPVGTIIKDFETDTEIVDLSSDFMQFVVAKGGRGGKGNSNFATATNQAPRFAEEGKIGVEKYVKLELKLLADVGLVGFPNAGKSTFISSISAARPKIADYPFTTLQPNLGIVKYRDYKTFTIADIPGIIEGASEGKGLGHKFLKHIERTKILLIMIDATDENYQKSFRTLIKELEKFSDLLAQKKKIVAFTKLDILSEEEIKKVKKRKIRNYSDQIYCISSVARINLDELIERFWKEIEN